MEFALGVLVLFGVFYLGWRFSSRRAKLPCPAWLRSFVEMDNPFAKSASAAAIVAGLRLAPGMTVMDIGCGPGRVTIPLAKAVGPTGKVYAVDIQEQMLAAVREKLGANDLRHVELLCLAMGEGRLPALEADRAVLPLVLGEIPNREGALREIYDALKPGGILAISETVFDPHFQTKQKVLDLATPLGFREVDFRGKKWAYTIYLQRG